MALRSWCFIKRNPFPLPAPFLPVSVRCTTTQSGAVEQDTSPPSREYYGCLRQLKTSPMKLNLVAKLIRGMNIGQALAQVEFCEKKAGGYVQMTLLDTQRRAANDGVDPLNLWVAESFVGKGTYLKRIRYHGKGMHGIMHKTYTHYFLKLKEGKPPAKQKKLRRVYLTKKFIQAGPRSIPNSL